MDAFKPRRKHEKGICSNVDASLIVSLTLPRRLKQAQKPASLTVVVPNTTILSIERISANYTAETDQSGNQALPAGENTAVFGRPLATKVPDLFTMDPGTKQYTKFGVDRLLEMTGDKLFDNVLEALTPALSGQAPMEHLGAEPAPTVSTTTRMSSRHCGCSQNYATL